MKQKSKIITLAVFLLAACGANATVTLNINADLLQTATTGTAAPSTGLVMLVANTTTTSGSFGNTSILQNAPLTVNSNIMPGDVILKEWTLGTGSGNTPGAFYDTASGLNMSSFGAATGNPLALLWFPTLTTGASTATAATPYGIYTGPGSSGSAPWSLPSDGSLVTLNMYTTNGALTTGTLAASNGVASYSVTAAPEPSRAILAALGLGLISLRRRRR